MEASLGKSADRGGCSRPRWAARCNRYSRYVPEVTWRLIVKPLPVDCQRRRRTISPCRQIESDPLRRAEELGESIAHSSKLDTFKPRNESQSVLRCQDEDFDERGTCARRLPSSCAFPDPPRDPLALSRPFAEIRCDELGRPPFLW